MKRLIIWRRDVRRFLTRPIPEGEVMEMLRLAQMAPSVGNSQPWRFVRIQSAAMRAALTDHVEAEGVAALRAIPDERKEAYSKLRLHGLREAPEVMAVFCDDGTSAGAGLGTATMPETRAYSVVLAIHTLWLAARAHGISVGWVSICDPAAVARLLDVPDGWRLIAVLCMGWPEAESDIPELERVGWQERTDWRANVSSR